MCECFEEIGEEMKKRTGAVDVKIMGKGSTSVDLRGYTQKGELSKVWKHESVRWNFCPICGEGWPSDDSDWYRRFAKLKNGIKYYFSDYYRRR